MMDEAVPIESVVDAAKWLLDAIDPAWLVANPVRWNCDPALPKPQPEDDPATAAAKQAAIDADALVVRLSIRALATEVLGLGVNPFLGMDGAEKKWRCAIDSAEMMLDEVPA